MNLTSLCQRTRFSYLWALIIAVLGFPKLYAQGAPPALVTQVQNTLQSDPENNGSNYMYPVRTWNLRERGPFVSTGEEPRYPPDKKTALVAMQRKLQQIVLPQVSFDHTRLADAIEFLRHESIRLDEKSEPDQKGVTIFIRLPPAPAADVMDQRSIPGLLPPELPILPEPAPTVLTMESTISLELRKTPLLEALRCVARAIGLRAKIFPNSVQLVAAATGIPTQEFYVPPQFVGLEASESLDAKRGMTVVAGHDVKTLLETRGVSFPPGTSAIYLPSAQKLVVRNLEDNLDLVQDLVLEYDTKFRPTPAPSNP